MRRWQSISLCPKHHVGPRGSPTRGNYHIRGQRRRDCDGQRPETDFTNAPHRLPPPCLDGMGRTRLDQARTNRHLTESGRPFHQTTHTDPLPAPCRLHHGPCSTKIFFVLSEHLRHVETSTRRKAHHTHTYTTHGHCPHACIARCRRRSKIGYAEMGKRLRIFHFLVLLSVSHLLSSHQLQLCSNPILTYRIAGGCCTVRVLV